MTRFYSPDSYFKYASCLGQIQTPRLKSSFNCKSDYDINRYLKQENKKIGNYYYSEKQQIGRGFSSCVYKAYHNQSVNQAKSPQPYAIKVIPLNDSTQSLLELLQNQIQVLKTLNHPNIIKCYDIYKSKTHYYIVTQYCAGGCLMKYMAKHQKNGRKLLPESKIVTIVQQIVDGMKYLHMKSVVHRDIKPANILKGKDGWKIADFGFAIFSNLQAKSKFNVGTPLYMPLQSLTENLYSPQSDIFSVGIIFYQLLAGITPWESRNQKQLIRKMQIIPLELTSGKNKITDKIFNLLTKLCCNKKTRMTKQQFNKLKIVDFLAKNQSQNENPENSIQYYPQTNQGLKSIKSQVYLERKLRQNKSMDHIQFLRQNQKAQIKNQLQLMGSLVFQRQKAYTKQDYLGGKLYQFSSKQKRKDEQKIFSYQNSKNIIFSSIKDRYFDISPSIKISNLTKKSTQIIQKEQNQKRTLRIQVKSANKLQGGQQQDKTLSTEAKSQQFQARSLNVDIKRIKQAQMSKIFQQIGHIILNQIHFCRFLFYMYKNLTFILISKKSQSKLSILIFLMIKKTLNEMNSLSQIDQHQKKSKFYDLQKLKHFLKTEKYQVIKKTIKEYQIKYEKEYEELIFKVGINQIRNIEDQQNQIKIKVGKMAGQSTKEDDGFSIYMLSSIKQFLRQFDHNLNLTINSISNSVSGSLYSPRSKGSNGFILSNVEGLKNLYHLYKMINLLIQSGNDYQQFESRSKIKVNIDYSKNQTSTIQDLNHLRQLIQKL